MRLLTTLIAVSCLFAAELCADVPDGETFFDRNWTVRVTGRDLIVSRPGSADACGPNIETDRCGFVSHYSGGERGVRVTWVPFCRGCEEASESKKITAAAGTGWDSCSCCTAAGRSLCKIIENSATDSRTFGPDFSRFEYQLDDRGFNTIHFMGSSALPWGFNIWGFVDFEGFDTNVARREDLSRFFLEIDIKRKIGEQWGLIAEVNDLQGINNTLGRLGVFYIPEARWLRDRHAFLFFKVFPYETDRRGSQFSLAWNKDFPNVGGGRLSAGGFCDLNFSAGAAGEGTVVVTEHQFRVRVAEQMYFLIEARLNEFLGDERDYGTGVGVQYRF